MEAANRWANITTSDCGENGEICRILWTQQSEFRFLLYFQMDRCWLNQCYSFEGLVIILIFCWFFRLNIFPLFAILHQKALRSPPKSLLACRMCNFLLPSAVLQITTGNTASNQQHYMRLNLQMSLTEPRLLARFLMFSLDYFFFLPVVSVTSLLTTLWFCPPPHGVVPRQPVNRECAQALALPCCRRRQTVDGRAMQCLGYRPVVAVWNNHYPNFINIFSIYFYLISLYIFFYFINIFSTALLQFFKLAKYLLSLTSFVFPMFIQ